MEPKPLDNQSLTRYLLGDLPEGERQEIEARFFADDEVFEELDALEAELRYDYAQGALSARDRKLFEARFVTNGEERRQAALAKAVLEKVEELKTARAVKPAAVVEEKLSWWRSLLAVLALNRPAISMAFGAVALVLMFGSAWLFYQTVRLREDVRTLQAAREAQERESREQTAELQDRNKELEQQLGEEQDRNKELEQQMANQPPQTIPQTPGQQIASTIASFLLLPGLSRDATAGAKRLTIAQDVKTVRLQLKVGAANDYRNFRATLKTVEGRQLWSRGGLRASGTTVVVSVPASVLTAGDYELTIAGQTESSTFEDVDDFYFTVVKK